MKERFGIIIAVIALLTVGGALTALLSGGEGIGGLLPFLQQTNNPEANPLRAEPWQTEQLFLLIAFLLVNLIGIGATIAGLFWFLNRGVAQARLEEAQEEKEN